MSRPSGPGEASGIAEAVVRAGANVPDDVLTGARLHLLDALSVGVAAGRVGPVAGVRALSEGGACSVLGADDQASASIAALVNGTLIHSLEFDDTHVASVMHGSSVMAPTALAVAEECGASGRAMLGAYAVGYEFLIRIGLASPGRIQARGFQITSAGGAFAAAAVSCLLRGDSARLMTEAIGIAGSQAGGTFAFLAEGDTVKAAQPGWAAHSGILAAELARAGVTGPRDVFQGRYGFFELYADDAEAGERLADLVGSLGSEWLLPAAAFKLMPCCHYIHPFVEAMIGLVDGGVAPESVQAVHCWVPQEVVPIIADPWADRQRPGKAHDARWSLPYVLALQVVKGRVNLTDFQGTCDESVMEWAGRISYESWADSGFPDRFPARVRMTLVDGTILDSTVSDVKGGASRPIEAGDVVAKVLGNLALGGMAPGAAAELVEQILHREDPDIASIGRVLRSVGARS
jgi:2-methylcitrate dehydratase PrpD